MAKHLEKLKGVRHRLSEMEDKLKNLKGKKARESLNDEIQDLRDQIKGHEKEIRQKWPDLGDDF